MCCFTWKLEIVSNILWLIVGLYQYDDILFFKSNLCPKLFEKQFWKDTQYSNEILTWYWQLITYITSRITLCLLEASLLIENILMIWGIISTYATELSFKSSTIYSETNFLWFSTDIFFWKKRFSGVSIKRSLYPFLIIARMFLGTCSWIPKSFYS